MIRPLHGPRPAYPASRSGFTLLEVMVSLTVLSVISLILFYCFSGVAKSQALLEESADIQTIGRVAMMRIKRELSLAFLSGSVSPTDSYRTLFRGEDSDPIDRVDFTSLSHERRVRDARESDQTEIGYFSESDPDSPYYMILHREAPRIDSEPDSGGVVLPMARRVKRLNLRYFDDKNRKWLDEWDSEGIDQSNALPRMVSIELVLADEQDREHVFRSRVFVRHMSPLGRD